MLARVAAVGSLVAAIVLIALVFFSNGSTYTLNANFQDAGGLVSGNQVFIGPAVVGSVKSIELTPDGQAQVTMGIDSGAFPMHEGTIARIYQNSQSGLANKYVVLEPGPQTAPAIKDGGLLRAQNTRSNVSLDQLFDSLDPLTRQGLRGFIRGEAASIQGRAAEGNATLRYLAPALASTSDVTGEISRDEPVFDSLLVQGAQALQTLAARSQELTQLIANTNATTAAIASQSRALQQALVQLPPTLNRSVVTFAGLRSTLDALTPVVNASKPASRRLAEFASDLGKLTNNSIPTIGQLNALISNPSGSDLTSLLLETPSLAKEAHAAFPTLIKELDDSQAQLDYLREFTPDVVGALTNFGQASGYYDANGHYSRFQPQFGAFGLNGANELTSKPPFLRYDGLQNVRSRCPGGAVQPPPDGSAPVAVPGCSTSTTPPGP
jgi:phospholipid/cholesterol/gamma-HCH transport system substrate-binding protein